MRPAEGRLLDQKRKMLISRLTIVVFSVTAVYMLLDFVLRIHVQFFIYVIFLASSAITYWLNQRDSRWAKIFGLTVFNLIIFLVASSEPFETGIHLYFVAAGAVALAVFGYEEWGKSISFTVLSLGLYVLVFLYDFNLIGYRTFTEEQARIFFLINMFIASFVCVYSILLFSKVHHEVENTLREQRESVRIANQELRKTNEELDRFVYSVSHDLRAPLSSILGLTDLFDLTTNETERKQIVEHIRGRAVRLDEFIHDVLDHARNSRANVEQVSVSLRGLVEEMVQALPAEKAKLFNWDIRVAPAMSVCTDPDRLRVILSNLIFNAVKYADLKKAERWIRVEASEPEGSWKLSVHDNGIGIHDEHQPRIFDMFYRAHTGYEGSGLGLYIVKEAVGKLNGTIALASTEGEGTKIDILFPRA